MAILLVPWAIWGVNAATAWVWPGRVAIAQDRLFGVSPPAPEPQLSALAVWSGAFQRAFAQHFDQSLPLLAPAVELKNQLYYSLLDQSGTPAIIVGKHARLFEPYAITEYCSRNLASLMLGADDWAESLARMQGWYAARGKVFLYVITPSKTATYPQYIPGGRQCRAPVADRDGFVAAWDAVLERHGVHYVDAASLIRQAKPGYPFELFPRGGTHWNEVGAALATQAIVRAVGSARLQDFAITWQMGAPVGTDRDLMDLMNLAWPALDYSVPKVTLVPTAEAVCDPPYIAMVGASFLYQICWTFMKLPCPPKIDFYSYFHVLYNGYPGDIRHAIDVRQRDAALLHGADIVILEENETAALRPGHGPAFYDFMAAQFTTPGE